MLDWHIYRRGLLALIPALIVALFSVDSVAEPLPPGAQTTGFDGRGATATARAIERLGPDRVVGGEADAKAADLIAQRFRQIPAGQLRRAPVVEQTITGGSSTENVWVEIPGELEDAILIVAPRTAADGPGRRAAATATGVLAQLATDFGDSRHGRTLVFASVADARAAAQLAAAISVERKVTGAVSIDDARARTTEDILLHRAPGDLMASSTLAETARGVIRSELSELGISESTPAQIARLGVGIGFGSQARLLTSGIDAISISATGELPPREVAIPDPGARALEVPITQIGTIALRVIQAVDAAPRLPGSLDAYVRSGDDVIPGWAIGLVVLSLLIAPLAASVDGLFRAVRRQRRAGRALRSVLRRSLPFVAALLALYVLAGIGVVPDPPFPFHPADFGIGFGELVALFALAGVVIAGAWLIRVDTVPSSYGGATLACAAGLLASVWVFGIWLVNPFSALLLLPIAHVWVLAASDRPPSRPLVLAGVIASFAPLVLAIRSVASSLGFSADAPWTVAMLITGGELRPAMATTGCLLAGCLISVLAASRRGVPR